MIKTVCDFCGTSENIKYTHTIKCLSNDVEKVLDICGKCSIDIDGALAKLIKPNYDNINIFSNSRS